MLYHLWQEATKGRKRSAQALMAAQLGDNSNKEVGPGVSAKSRSRGKDRGRANSRGRGRGRGSGRGGKATASKLTAERQVVQSESSDNDI